MAKNERMKAKLAKLESENPTAFRALCESYIAEGRAALNAPGKKRGRDSRPDFFLIWQQVRAIMEVQGVGHPTACDILADRNSRQHAPSVFSWREPGAPRKSWMPISDAQTLARYYRSVNRFYKNCDAGSKAVLDSMRDQEVKLERQRDSS